MEKIQNHPFRVLLIEEDSEVAQLIKTWLTDYAEVTHVTEKVQAMLLVQDERWDLVISDTQFPEFNDLDLTKLVKSIHPNVAVLIVTANQKVDFILNAMQVHSDGLLFKPLEKEKFLELALKLANHSKTHHQNNRKIILAIGAHPDDVEIGCAGALALHYAKGDIINILTLSLGEAGGNPYIREREATTAAKLLHANLFLQKLPDTKIPYGKETIAIIEELVEQINPTHVYTHSVNDSHPDHCNVHNATISSTRFVHNVYCYQSPSSTVNFKPHLFVDITNYFDQKLQALAVYKSQNESRLYLKTEMIHANALYWGRFCNYGLAEPMEVVREKNI